MLFILIILCLLAPAKLLDRTLKEVISNIIEPSDINCSTPACDGPLAPIYCFGPILFTAYSLKLDGQCPGKRMLQPPSVIIEKFQKLQRPVAEHDFRNFCSSSFEQSNFVEKAQLPDWRANPEKFELIHNEQNRKLAIFINDRWKNLTRKFIDDVLKNPTYYPVIPVKRHFIIPGEPMFDVYFYWDTYWIAKGLLISGMYETVRGIIDNYAELVDALGFIPNGGYIYFQRRTQPPMFVQMIDDYYSYTKDLKSVEKWLPLMDKEIQFWMKNRAIEEGALRGMYIYKAGSDCPRPENFLSDLALGMMSKNPQFTWKAISSACESGWDFSSRWFASLGNDAFEKFTIHTHEIVPVDLNVFMVLNFRVMSKFKAMLKEEKFAKLYQTAADSLESVIHKFMWNHTTGIWYDLNKNVSSHRVGFYPSNVYPLLLGNLSSDIVGKVKEYLSNVNVLNYPGGIPATLPRKSFEQWDFPNVWAPNQHLFVMSLWNSNDKELVQEGTKQALKFIEVVYKGVFEPAEGARSGIWEKYNATRGDGFSGGGGEYPVQEGFGWTNGAVLDLIFRNNSFFALSLDRSWWKPVAGGSPHIYIIGGALAFLIGLAISYSLCGISNNMGRYDHLSDEDQSSAALLGSIE